MGVLGLTPFIQKICPDAIRHLPDRLQGLSGKRIVLDGTLLTQRFHFAPIPHPYRHVLGWYRLIKELEDCGVEALCVFDGKERNIAKAREVLRRKQHQKLISARGVLENERLARLNQISSVVRDITKLSTREKVRVSGVLSELTSKKSTGVRDKDLNSLMKEAATTLDILLPSWEESDVWSAADPAIMEEWFLEHHYPSTSVPSHSELEDAFRLESSVAMADAQSSIPDSKQRTLSRAVESELQSKSSLEVNTSPQSTVERITSALAPLLMEYQSSIPKVASIPLHTARPSATAEETVVDIVEADTAKAEYEMSKRQYELTLQEGKFWDNLASSLGRQRSSTGVAPADGHDEVLVETPEFTATNGHEEMLQELTHRSNLISESYKRSGHPPTAQTYEQCKELLKAMGVTCLECEGPYEAEALASSLVLNGHADYVASEDTDVLIYEAPLIRNITSRQQPLLVISGAELRSMLKLSRPMFVDFALLLGTDFSQRIKNVGPSRALGFIRAHGSIEKVIEVETKFKTRVPHDDYLRQVKAGRTVFQTLPPVPQEVMFKPQKSDLSQITFIMGRYGLSREVDEVDWDSEDALRGNYFDDSP